MSVSISRDRASSGVKVSCDLLELDIIDLIFDVLEGDAARNFMTYLRSGLFPYAD